MQTNAAALIACISGRPDSVIAIVYESQRALFWSLRFSDATRIAREKKKNGRVGYHCKTRKNNEVENFLR